MSNKQNFNNFFPTDNSSSTNLKYDLVASKFMTGIDNHKRTQHYNSQSNAMFFGIIGGIFQIAFGLILVVFALLRSIYNSLK